MEVIHGVRKRGCTRLTNRGQQAVARHAVKHTGLAQQHDQDHRRQAGNGAELDELAHPAHARAVGGDGDRVRHIQLRVRHNPGGNGRDHDVEHGADQEGADDADGHVALRILGFLGGGADGVEADVGEEDDTRAGHNSRPAEVAGLAGIGGDERMPVGGM